MSNRSLPIVLSALMTIASAYGANSIKVIHSGIVNDKIVDAQCPMGLAKDDNGNYVTVFMNRGDGVAGCTSYFVSTDNLGKTWSDSFMEYAPNNEKIGSGISFFQLKNGKVLGALLDIEHEDTSLEGFKGYRTSVAKVAEIDLKNKKIIPQATLKAPETSLPAPMGNNFIELSNGDILLPCYVYPQAAPDPYFPYGSGFYRSKDKGKTWGDFERAFEEPDAKNPLSFNESVIFEKPDHTLVAFARIDSRPINNMWKVTSKDFGATWSKPEETNIPAVYPVGLKTAAGQYLMTAGYLKAAVPRTTTVFFSEDGEKFKPIGMAYYSRPGGGHPYNTATGGSQAIIEVSSNRYLLTFYSADPKLGGRDNCYVDSCLFELR